VGLLRSTQGAQRPGRATADGGNESDVAQAVTRWLFLRRDRSSRVPIEDRSELGPADTSLRRAVAA